MPQGPLAALTGREVLTMIIVGRDVGYGDTKCVTARGTDVFPSVVGEWRAPGFRFGAGLEGIGRSDGIEGVTMDGRSYTVRERALRLAHWRFVGLSLRRGALHVGDDTVPLGALLEPWLERHAEAIVSHARMLWGERARGLARLWVTGGGGPVLGSRLQALAPHAEIVPHARLQNAMGYFRYGQRLQRELDGRTDAVSA